MLELRGGHWPTRARAGDASVAPTGRGASAVMLAEVRAGLIEGAARGQRTLPAKYFYDHRGSELFEEITRLPEYYLTRTERAVLRARVPAWIDAIRPRALVELGAGSADKTRTILDAMERTAPVVTYVPVDVSVAFLDETAERLRLQYPRIEVEPLVADFAAGERLPLAVPHPMLAAFLGSTVGNLEDPEAIQVLAGLRLDMQQGDRLLLGADLVKDRAIIEAAYNDRRGVTATFNRNMLVVLNRELGANFDPAAFAHWAFFDEAAGRIEMHLVATSDQCVCIPGLGMIGIPRGESIRTEISNKYTRERLVHILAAAGLDLTAWETDDAGGYTLLLAARRD
jgi:L-histidine Nalpha-methyltransferase